MVLLAAVRQPESQLRLQELLNSNPMPATHVSQADTQRLPVEGHTLTSGGGSGASCRPPEYENRKKLSRPTAPQERTHEQIVAAYEAKERAFAAQNKHDPTALTSPELKELLHPMPLSQPWLQYQTHLPPQRQRAGQRNQQQQQHSKRTQSGGISRCIMPGTLHSLSQIARLEPRWSRQSLRPPTGPSAPRKRTAASAPSRPASASSGQQGQHKRQRLTALQPRQQLQAMVAAGLQHGNSRLIHGLRVDPTRTTVTSPLHSFFSRRSRMLRANGSRTRHFLRQPSAVPSDGLLSLPQDVLVTTFNRPPAQILISCC